MTVTDLIKIQLALVILQNVTISNLNSPTTINYQRRHVAMIWEPFSNWWTLLMLMTLCFWRIEIVSRLHLALCLWYCVHRNTGACKFELVSRSRVAMIVDIHNRLLNVWFCSSDVYVFAKLIVYIYFISRGNLLNNKVNLPYGPQTITIATKHTTNYYKLRRVTQDIEFWVFDIWVDIKRKFQ